jgi:hypothetical protein
MSNKMFSDVKPDTEFIYEFLKQLKIVEAEMQAAKEGEGK